MKARGIQLDYSSLHSLTAGVIITDSVGGAGDSFDVLSNGRRYVGVMVFFSVPTTMGDCGREKLAGIFSMKYFKEMAH